MSTYKYVGHEFMILCKAKYQRKNGKKCKERENALAKAGKKYLLFKLINFKYQKVLMGTDHFCMNRHFFTERFCCTDFVRILIFARPSLFKLRLELGLELE